MSEETKYGEVVDDTNETILDAGTAMTATVKAEIDIQISTAKRYPRSITHFRKQAMELATLDEDTAATMFYVLPRGNKKIEGPSARLAEVVGSSWGNLRYGAQIVAIGDKFLTAEGACHDLETNNAAKVQVQRRITGKDGKRFNDDMIGVTANAACSIALRQAIFKIVPFAFVKPVYEAARLCSIGKAKSMASKRAAAIDWFKKAGATEADVLAFLDKQGIEEMTDDDLITLRGVVQAIKEGETTIEEALGREPKGGGKKVADSALNEKLKAAGKNGNGKKADEPVVEPDPSHGEAPDGELPSLATLADELALATMIGDVHNIEKKYLDLLAEEGDQIEVGIACADQITAIKAARGK